MKPEVNVEETSPVQRTLKITVPPELINVVWSQVLQEFSQKVELPGFRKGKAPTQMVEKMYGDRIRQEALERVIQISFRDSIDQKDLRPINSPDIQPESKDFNRLLPFSYKASFEVPPKINLKKVKGLKTQVQKIVATESDVDEYLENLRVRTSSLTPLEGRETALIGDYVTMDYAGFDEAGAPLPQTQGQGYTVELGSKSLIPGFEEGLVGVKVGETREVPVEFPKDYSFEALRGKKAKFTVNVKDIKSRKLPDMTAEWLKEVGGDGTDTVEQLKNKIRQDMEHHHVKHFEEDVRAALRRELVKENTFFAPPSLVQMQYDSLVENLKQRLERERMGPAQVEDILKKNEKDLRDAADHQVRASLIIHEICRQENLTVTEQDVEDGLKKWAQTADTNIERVRELARREGWLDSMRQELLDEKVYGFLKAHATIDEKVVSAREHHH